MKLAARGTPNASLRWQRLERGWSLRHVADELCALCQEEDGACSITADMIGKWERGIHRPSPFYREKFCRLYGLSADQLGFIEPARLSSAAKTTQPQSTSAFTDDSGDRAQASTNANDTLEEIHTYPAIFSASQGHVTIEKVPGRQSIPLPERSVVQELETQDMDKSRRQMLQAILSIACTTLVLPPQELLDPDSWERLSMAITKPASLDNAVLFDLETITKSYWRLRSNAASYDLLSGVLGHFQTITQIMRRSPQPEAIYEHLHSIGSETAQIIGQILFDMHDYATAWSYYKFSINAAQGARNYDLEAVGLGRMSFLFTYSGQAQQTLPLLQEAQHLTRQSSITTIYPWLAAIEAEVYANLQDANACFRALDRAELITAQPTLKEDPYATGFNLSRLAGYKGVCFVHLHKTEAALATLNEALRLAHPLAIRRQSTLLTDIAMAHVQRGEIEEACKLANQALAITSQTNSISVLQRIRNLRHELELWKHTQCVKDLDEQLATTLMSITY